MKRFSHMVLFVAVVWWFGIPASAQDGNDKGTTKSPHLESLKWPKQLLDGIMAVRPKSGAPKADDVPPKSDVEPTQQERTPKAAATAPEAADSGDQAGPRAFSAEENSLASLDAEIDLIATALLQLQKPAAVIELYDRWYESYKADNQEAGNSNDNLKKFRTLAAYLNSAFAERMLAQQLLSPQTVEDKDAGKLKSRVEIFQEANVHYANAISTISSGLQAYEEWRTTGLPKPDTDNDVVTGKFSTSPMTAFRSAEFFQMLLLWQGRLYRELGDVVYRETGSSFATSKSPPPKGYTQNSTARAWYLLARDPLYMGIVLDKNNREVQREAELVTLRLSWIEDNRIFGGVDFFQFPTHREGYITDFFDDKLKETYGKLNVSQDKVGSETKSQAAWLTNLQNQQGMRDSLDRGFAQIQRDGLEKSISEITEKTNATVSRVAWERLQNIQSQFTNANLYATNKLHIAHLNNDYGQEKARLQLELTDVLHELKLQGIYGHTSILDHKGLETVAGSLQLSLSLPANSKIDVTNDCLQSFPLIVNLANSIGVTSKAGGSYKKVADFFSAPNQQLESELRKAWEEAIDANNLSRLSVQYLEVYKAYQTAVTKVVELNTFFWETERSRIQQLVYERQRAYSDAMAKLQDAERAFNDNESQESKDALLSAASNAVDELKRQSQIDQERIRLDQSTIDRHQELLAAVKKLETFQEVGKVQLLGKAYIASLIKTLPSYTFHTQGVSSGFSTDPVWNEIKKVDAALNYAEFAHNLGVAYLQNRTNVISRSNELAKLQDHFNTLKDQVNARAQQLEIANENLTQRKQSAEQLRTHLVSVNKMRAEADELLKQYEASKNLYQPSNNALKNNERTLLELAREQAIADVYSKLVEVSVAAAKSDQLIEKAAQITARLKTISDSEEALKAYGTQFGAVINTFQRQEAEAVSSWTEAQKAEQKYLLERSDDLAQKLMELSSPKERVVTADFLKQFAPAFVDAELTAKMQADLDLANQHLANVARWLYLFSGEQTKCLQLATPARSVGELQMAIENARAFWDDIQRQKGGYFGTRHNAVVCRFKAQSDIGSSSFSFETRFEPGTDAISFDAHEVSPYVENDLGSKQLVKGYNVEIGAKRKPCVYFSHEWDENLGAQTFMTGCWVFTRQADATEWNILRAQIERNGPVYTRSNGRRHAMPYRVASEFSSGVVNNSRFMLTPVLVNEVLSKVNAYDADDKGFQLDLNKLKPVGLDGSIFGFGLDGDWRVELKDTSGKTSKPYQIKAGDVIDVVFLFLPSEVKPQKISEQTFTRLSDLTVVAEATHNFDDTNFFADDWKSRPGQTGTSVDPAEIAALIDTELDTVFNRRPNANEATPPVNLLQVRNQAEEILNALIGSVQQEYLAKLEAAKSTIEGREPLQDQIKKLITILSEEGNRYGKADEYATALFKLKESVVDGGLEPTEQEELKSIIDSLNQEMLIRQTLKEWCADETKRQALIDHILNDLVLKYQGAED